MTLKSNHIGGIYDRIRAIFHDEGFLDPQALPILNMENPGLFQIRFVFSPKTTFEEVEATIDRLFKRLESELYLTIDSVVSQERVGRRMPPIHFIYFYLPA